MTQKTEKELHEMLESFQISDQTNLINLVDKIREIVDNNSSLRQVEEFMTTFNQKIRKYPEIPTKEECKFRLNLCLEENTEIAEACGSEVLTEWGRTLFNKSQEIYYQVEKGRENIKPNLIALLDGLEDSQYVLDGFKLTTGLHIYSEEAQLEVHNSNMSKACNDNEELQTTLEKYEKEGIEVTAEGKEIGLITKYLVLRKSDKKVLKSINYRPANLTKIFPIRISQG